MDNVEKKETVENKIDISKISNLDVMKDTNPSVQDFVDKAENKKEKQVATALSKGYETEHFEKYPRKFEFVQPERVKLPSNGVCYRDCDDPDIKEGYIWIYPLTMKEEEILSTNKYIYEGTATIMALNNCIKSNINAIDLLVSDFYFLLMYLRKISISDKFTFNIECPHCSHKFKYDINISEVKFPQFEKGKEYEPIRIDLEVTDYTVIIVLPRIKTIREISWFINNSKNEIGVAEFLYSRTLAIIAPNGSQLPKEDWILFFNNLPHKDSEKLYELAKFDSGINNIVGDTTCPNCGKTIEGSAVDLNTDDLFRF